MPVGVMGLRAVDPTILPMWTHGTMQKMGEQLSKVEVVEVGFTIYSGNVRKAASNPYATPSSTYYFP